MEQPLGLAFHFWLLHANVVYNHYPLPSLERSYQTIVHYGPALVFLLVGKETLKKLTV